MVNVIFPFFLYICMLIIPLNPSEEKQPNN